MTQTANTQHSPKPHQNNAELNQLGYLHQVAQELDEATDIDDLLETLANFANTLQANAGFIYIIEDIGTEYFRCSSDDAEFSANFYQKVYANLPSGSTDSLIINDLTSQTNWNTLTEDYPQFTAKSLLIVPLEIYYGRALGFVMYSHDTPQFFPNTMTEFAETLGIQTTIVLKNILLFQDSQESLAEAQILLDASRELFATANIDAVYKTMAQAFIASGADRCTLSTILELDEDNNPKQSEIVAIRGKTSLEKNLDLDTMVKYTHDLSQYPYLSGGIISRDIITITDVDTDSNLNDLEREYLKTIGAKAAAVVPLFSVSTGKPLGYIFIEHVKSYNFSPREVALYRTIANQTTIAIENARQIAATHQRAKQIETGAEISKITSSILNQQELIDRAVNLIRDGFELYYVGLFLVDEAREWANLKAGTGAAGQDQIKAGHRLALNGKSMIGWSIINKQARIASDVGKDAVHFNNPHLPDTRSEMALPLISRNVVVGALTVQSVKAAAFSNDDIITLQIMADQLANAILNSRLYQTSEKSANELSLLLETNRDISASTDLNELLNLIIIRATEIVNGEHGTIFLVEGNNLKPYAVAGGYEEEIMSVTVPIGTGFSGGAAQTRQSITKFIESPNPDTHVPGTPFVPESLVAVPIKTETNLIGVLLIRRVTNPEEFTTAEVKLLEGMALQAAIAVENASLLKTTQKSQHIADMLYQINRLMTDAESINEVVNIAVEGITKERFDRVVVAMKDDPDDPDDIWVENIAVWDRNGQEKKYIGNRFTEAQIPLMEIVDNEDAVIINDFNTYPKIDDRIRTVFTKILGVKSAIIIVIHIGQKVLGWFLAETTLKTATFSDDDLTPLLAAVDQLASNIDRIQKTESLKKAGKQYLAMVDNIPGAVYRGKLGKRYTLIYVSDDLKDITGYDTHLFTEKGNLSISDIIHPDDQQYVNATIQRKLNQKSSYQIQYRIINKNGQIKHVSERGTGVFDRHNNLLYVDGVIFDVTDRVKLEQSAQHRATQLEAVAQVSQKASGILDVDRLLAETVDLICENFGFYYAALFLLDNKNEWAILRAGFGEPGKKMLAQNHRLKRDNTSMVGWATYYGEAHVALDAGKEKHRFNNPHLPLTRSEIALPLISQGTVIGALDVQSEQENAFGEEEIATLQLMANQLANVIANARLFETTERNLNRANLLYQTTQALLAAKTESELFDGFIETISQADIDSVSFNVYGTINQEKYFETKAMWSRDHKTIYTIGSQFNYNNSAVFQLLAENDKVIVKDTRTDERLNNPIGQQILKQEVYAFIAFNIIIQGQKLGAIIISSKNKIKTFSDTEVRFLESLVQQLTITWQNLRLVTSIERRFRRERVIRELTGKVHAAVGVENILHTTVTELSKALDTSGAIARLGTHSS